MKEDTDIIKVLRSSKLTPSQKVNVISELNNKQNQSKSKYPPSPPSEHY